MKTTLQLLLMVALLPGCAAQEVISLSPTYSPPTLQSRSIEEPMIEEDLSIATASPESTRTRAVTVTTTKELQLTYIQEQDSGTYSLQAVTIECSANGDVSIGDQIELFSIHNSRPYGYSWSPDGTKLVYSAYGKKDSYDLFIVDQDGVNIENITNSPINESSPSWSPDGTKIIYTLYTRLGSLLYWTSEDGEDGGEFIDTAWDTPIFFSSDHPRWSSDGKYFAYTAIVDPDDGIYQVILSDSEGFSTKQLTNNNYSSYTPGFSPDGTRLVISRDIPDHTEYGGDIDSAILIIQTDGTGETMLIGSRGESSITPTWSPSCNLIAFQRREENPRRTDIYLSDPEASYLLNVTKRPNTINFDPRWRIVTVP